LGLEPALDFLYNNGDMDKRAHTSVHEGSELLVDVARAYYEAGLTQSEIAEQYGLSRSQISRYLKAARDAGIVQIRVIPLETTSRKAETRLRARFPQLREVRVASVLVSEGTPVRRAVARAGARLLESVADPGWTLCFGAGRTLAELVGFLGGRALPGTTVVQAMGNAGHEALEIDYNAIAQAAGAAFGAAVYQINAPAILGPGLSAAELEASNRPIQEALEMARRADLYAVGIGSMSSDELYVTTGLVSLEELEQLRQAGAVGDICGNFFDLAGRPTLTPYGDRLVGIRLEHLQRARNSLAFAAGSEKVPAILGALAGGFISGLVTDEITAAAVLSLADEQA
jgi:deoxyribonucleoside regulator